MTKPITTAEHAERLTLYNQGFNDRQIAEQVNLSYKTIADWRKANGLPTHNPKIKQREYQREYHAKRKAEKAQAKAENKDAELSRIMKEAQEKPKPWHEACQVWYQSSEFAEMWPQIRYTRPPLNSARAARGRHF